MNESHTDKPKEDNTPPVKNGGHSTEGLLQSPIGLDALNAAKGFLLAGVPFQSAIRQAATCALDQAGVCKAKAAELEVELVSSITNQMLRPVVMKLAAPGEMTIEELKVEIRAAGFNEPATQKLAEEFYPRRERIRKVAAAKVKAAVMERFKDRQTNSQREKLGRVLDEMFTEGVPSRDGDFVAAWRAVNASETP